MGQEGLELEVGDGRAQNPTLCLTRDQTDTEDPAEHESDARQALDVAGRVAQIMSALCYDSFY
jgi:hypothetical protein